MDRVSRDQAVARIEEMYGELDCLMCGVLADHGVNGLRVAETEHCLVVLTRFPRRRGHLMVVLREHVESVGRVSAVAWADASEQARRASVVLEAIYEPHRIYVASLGHRDPSIVMTCAHVHVHVIPVYETSDRPADVLSWHDGVGHAEEAWWQAERTRVASAWHQRFAQP